MTELQYAISVGVKIEYKNLADGTVLATWNNGMCNEIISQQEYSELTLEDKEINSLESKLVELFGEVKTANEKVKSILENKLIECKYDGKRYFFKVEGYNFCAGWGVICCTNNGKVVISNSYNYPAYGKTI